MRFSFLRNYPGTAVPGLVHFIIQRIVNNGIIISLYFVNAVGSILPPYNGGQNMIRLYTVAALIFLFFTTNAQQQASRDVYIAAKNYYLLTALQQDNGARKLVEQDTVLATLLQAKLSRLSQAPGNCKNDIACFTENIKLTNEEISTVSVRLAALYKTGNALGRLVQQQLVPSHKYILFEKNGPQELLTKAWEQDAAGINFLIGVYAEGKKANYPNIDSIAFNVQANGYSRLLYSLDYLVLNECKDSKLFFLPSLTAAQRLLEINERQQASDYEPMENGENKAAVERIKTIKWEGYKYSVIMVPGAGPEEATVALSAEGMLRCRLAALQFRKGLAPFIVTSGGKVHPYKTRYCEAVEMKKFLVETLHVPAAAILIDPHARHTTTNMRNTVRLIYRYHIPFSKPGITCTTRGQSAMIETTLVARCMKELNETPYRNGVRLSETEMEFYPLMEALHINPSEPMDP